MRRALLLALGLLAAAGADAQEMVDAGEYRVYYAAINSSALAPEIARRYGTVPARDVALISFNVQRRESDRYLAVPAQGRASARSLLGHRRELTLRAVRDGDVQTLVAETRFDDGEFLLIEAEILPAGAEKAIAVKFRRQFYRD